MHKSGCYQDTCSVLKFTPQIDIYIDNVSFISSYLRVVLIVERYNNNNDTTTML